MDNELFDVVDDDDEEDSEDDPGEGVRRTLLLSGYNFLAVESVKICVLSSFCYSKHVFPQSGWLGADMFIKANAFDGADILSVVRPPKPHLDERAQRAKRNANP